MREKMCLEECCNVRKLDTKRIGELLRSGSTANCGKVLDEVLDEALDDALRLTELDSKFGQFPSSHEAYFQSKENDEPDIDAFLPACQRAASNPKYRALFLNESMSHIILDKMYNKERSIRIPDIMASHHLSEWEADIIFRYMLYGNFAVNKSLAWVKNEDWYHAQDVIRSFTAPKELRRKKGEAR